MTSRTPRRTRRLTEADRRQLEEFAVLLRNRMDKLDMSTKELEERSGISQDTIRSYLQARNRPSKGSMQRLQNVLGKDIAQPFAKARLAGHRPQSGFVIILGDENSVVELRRSSMSTEGALAMYQIARKEGLVVDKVNDKDDQDQD